MRVAVKLPISLPSRHTSIEAAEQTPPQSAVCAGRRGASTYTSGHVARQHRRRELVASCSRERGGSHATPNSPWLNDCFCGADE